jgi:hypothetical protein
MILDWCFSMHDVDHLAKTTPALTAAVHQEISRFNHQPHHTPAAIALS